MFITFEGIEGCGKTTQIARLAKRLEESGIPPVLTLEPGGTRIGRSIPKVLLDSQNVILSPLAELFLYAADRAQHIEEIIKPALKQGKWVISDRFFDATIAYQGSARGQDMELIEIINEKASRGIQPGITFLLDCPVELGLGRARKRNSVSLNKGQDRFEREQLDFHAKVRDGYLALARSHPDRFVVVDATRTEEGVEQEIFHHLRPLVEKVVSS